MPSSTFVPVAATASASPAMTVNISRPPAPTARSCRTSAWCSPAWHSTPERESLVTITLKPDSDGTLMIFHHAQFFDETARDNHQRGWGSFFDKLDAFVA
jgi:hypothetical protein